MIDKASEMTIGKGLEYSLVAILMVFAILTVIILIANVISAIIRKSESKNAIVSTEPNASKAPETLQIDESDEDLMAAILVATIDYQTEIKKDVRVISVRPL